MICLPVSKSQYFTETIPHSALFDQYCNLFYIITEADYSTLRLLLHGYYFNGCVSTSRVLLNVLAIRSIEKPVLSL